jgi:hypothetical protein
MMAAKPAKEPSQNVARTPERATARSTRAASSPPAPLSMQISAPRFASSASRFSSNGSGSRLAGFSPTPRLTAMCRGARERRTERHVGLGAGHAEGFFGPRGGQFGKRAVRRAAVGAALEKVVAILGQTGSKPSCVRRESESMTSESGRVQERLQIVPQTPRRSRRCRGGRPLRRGECAGRRRTARSSSRAHKDDLGIGKTLLGGVEQHAGHGHVRAQGDAREHEDAMRLAGNGRRGRRTRDSGPPARARPRPGHGDGHGLREPAARRRRTAAGSKRSARPFRQDAEQRLAAGSSSSARQLGGGVPGDRRAPAVRARSRYTKYLSIRIPSFWRVASGTSERGP